MFLEEQAKGYSVSRHSVACTLQDLHRGESRLLLEQWLLHLSCFSFFLQVHPEASKLEGAHPSVEGLKKTQDDWLPEMLI